MKQEREGEWVGVGWGRVDATYIYIGCVCTYCVYVYYVGMKPSRDVMLLYRFLENNSTMDIHATDTYIFNMNVYILIEVCNVLPIMQQYLYARMCMPTVTRLCLFAHFL